MALPWLESVPVWGAAAMAGDLPAPCPKRFAACSWAVVSTRRTGGPRVPAARWSSGHASSRWRRSGPRSTWSPACSTSTPRAWEFIPGQTGNILSGAALQKGAELKGGISIDQELARHLGEQTVQPSMVLGCEQPITGYHETNFSMAYSSHISWQSATSPVPMEVYPSLAFDSLFDNRGSKRNQSILDRVREEAADSSRKVSGATGPSSTSMSPASVRSRNGPPQCEPPNRRPKTSATDRGQSAVTMPRPDNGLPEDIREHMRLMCDIVALGFQTDKTRIATLLLCRDISGLFYPFLDVREAHHPASHSDQSTAYERVTRYYLQPARLPRFAAGGHARR